MKNKNSRIFRTLRVVIAFLFMILFLFSFCFAENAAVGFLKIQLGPGIASLFNAVTLGAALTVTILLVITLIFGRFYCAVFCPLGIFQDLLGRLLRAKNRGPKKEPDLLRFSLTGIVFGLLFGGSVLGFLVFDPFANFGAFLSSFYRSAVSDHFVWTAELGAGIFSLLFLVLIVLIKRRAFCRWFCPVGTLLELTASCSVFRFSFTKQCVSCGKCEKICPTQCIDLSAKVIDDKRCVRCLDCLSACPSQGIRFGVGTVKLENPPDQKRRRFTKSILALPIFFGVGAYCEKDRQSRKITGATPLLLPPGAGDTSRFTNRCDACHLCVTQCPTKILQPSPLRKGPVLLDPLQGGCQYNCVRCGEVCPTGALPRLPLEQKRSLRLGTVEFDPQYCLAVQDNEACSKCADVCPNGSLIIRLSRTQFHLPDLDPDSCTGCGSCVFSCPAVTKALTIKPVEKQIPIVPKDQLRNSILLVRNGAAKCVLMKKGKIVEQKNNSSMPKGEILDRRNGSGVLPLLEIYREKKDLMSGAIIIDKVIGRAAAMILLSAKVARIHAELIGEDALDLLLENHVKVSYRRMVPQILNRKKDGPCPLDQSVENIIDPEKAVDILLKYKQN